MHLFIIGAPASGKMTIIKNYLDGRMLPIYNHQAIDFALRNLSDYTEKCGNLFGITFSFWSKKSAISNFNRCNDFKSVSSDIFKANSEFCYDYHQEILC